MSVMLTYTIGEQNRQVILDASVNESHTAQAQITEHQVEKGSNVTDHIRPMPQRISIDGLVTNTPIVNSLQDLLQPPLQAQDNGFSGSQKRAGNTNAKTLQFDSSFDRVKNTYGELVDAAKKGVLLTVYTSLKTYSNMAIYNLSVPRNAANGNALSFRIDLQEIVQVEVQLVKSTSPNNTKKKRGNQPARQAPPKTEQPTQQASEQVVETSATLKLFSGG